MIICYAKDKDFGQPWVFVKTRKTAGSSLQVSFARFCTEQDIVSGILAKEDKETLEVEGYVHRNKDGWMPHDPVWKIRKHLGQDFKKFKIIAGVRNPWDKVVSHFWWETKREPEPCQDKFESWLWASRLLGTWNDLDILGDYEAIDFVIRYEHLEDDYRTACLAVVGAADYRPMPRLKIKQRQSKAHYSAYYSNHTREFVRNLFADYIRVFGYEFEEVHA